MAERRLKPFIPDAEPEPETDDVAPEHRAGADRGPDRDDWDSHPDVDDRTSLEAVTDSASVPFPPFRIWLRTTSDPAFARLRSWVYAKAHPQRRRALFADRFSLDDWIAHFEDEGQTKLVDVVIQAAAVYEVERDAWVASRDAVGHGGKRPASGSYVTPEVTPPALGELAVMDRPPVCQARDVMGRRICELYAVPGTRRCPKHGGELVDAETRREILLEAYARIVGHASEAVAALAEIAAYGRNELARVQAAKEILDRAGLTPELQISVRLETESREARLSALSEKLNVIQANLVESGSVDPFLTAHLGPIDPQVLAQALTSAPPPEAGGAP